MMFKTHLAVSLLIAIWLFPAFSYDSVSFLLMFMLGTLFPDIDSTRSFLGHFVKIGWFFRHRGIFHSIFLLLGFSALLYLSTGDIAVAFGLGYLLHMILDMMTKAGIRPFYPFRFRIRGFIRNNGLIENGILVASLIGCMILIL